MPRPRSCRRGFSLIELLTTIAIIALLGSLLATVIIKVLGDSKEELTKIQLQGIATGIVLMRDTYQYTEIIGKDATGALLPSTTAGGVRYIDLPFDIMSELDPNNPEWKATYSPHLNAKRKSFAPTKAESISNGRGGDEWRNPIHYGVRIEIRDMDGNGTDDEIQIEVITSAGDDEVLGTKDDIIVETGLRKVVTDPAKMIGKSSMRVARRK